MIRPPEHSDPCWHVRQYQWALLNARKRSETRKDHQYRSDRKWFLNRIEYHRERDRLYREMQAWKNRKRWWQIWR